MINKKLDELNLNDEQKEELRQNFLHTEAEQLRQARKKMSITEFEPLTIIGRGAFGEVRVCRQISTGDIVAVKKMRKEDMLNKNQLMHVRTEKEIMTASNPWIVKLKYSFQDEYYLYLVMDFLPGGDLMNLLMKKEILTEDEARFYTAEMILAVDSVHKLNCIHRDLKPDNILIDKHGHIQLSDFGLAKIDDKTFFPLTVKDVETPKKLVNIASDSITTANTNILANSNANPTKGNYNLNFKNKNILKKIPKKNRLIAYSTVGTPDYIAPEVFSQNGYGEEADWWSIGVMFFEMVVGFPPFFSENPSDTCKKIVKWKEHFSIPSDANLSPEAENFILRMVSPPEKRLGVHGVEEIKKHPFFKGIDWNNVRKMKAPFIPELKYDYDTHYFDTFQEQEPFYPPASASKGKQRKDVNYAGYTFNRDNENIKDSFVQALEVLEVVERTTAKKKVKEIITDSNSPDLYKINEEKVVTNKKIDTKNKSPNIQTNNINSSNQNKIKIPASINNMKENKPNISNNTNSENNGKKLTKDANLKSKPGIGGGDTNLNSNIIRLTANNSGGNTIESKRKENLGNTANNSKSKEKEFKKIKMNKSKDKDNKLINANSKSKEKDKIILFNKIKEKENKLINKSNKSKEKDKIIILNKSKGKDNKLNASNSKSKGKEAKVDNNTKEQAIQKSVNMTNKISIGKNIKEVKKGNKSPSPGNTIIKKKMNISNSKQKPVPTIKISPGKISKEKINSAKTRLNTDNTNLEDKKNLSKQSQRLKSGSKRKNEKSPTPNLILNK